MLDSFWRGGYKNHVKIATQIWKHIFSVQSFLYLTTSVSNNLDYVQLFYLFIFFFERKNQFLKCFN